MTVLEAEEESTDEQLTPPRKKLCLQLPRVSVKRNQSLKGKSENQPSGRAATGQITRHFQSNTGGKMLNELQRLTNNQRDSGCDAVSNSVSGASLKVATLCNLGNTCFLNSVLYTLRCTPSFLHNLHHLSTDLAVIGEKQLQTKIKISSLGRSSTSSTTSSSRSWSSKDLPSLTAHAGTELNKPKIQVATEKLHDMFMSLRELEIKENNEPFQPDAFLQALRDVNPIFEGNQQQDAHELLVCLLDNIRETFQLLLKQRENQKFAWKTEPSESQVELTTELERSDSGKRLSRNKSTSKKGKKAQVQATLGVQTTLNLNGGNKLTIDKFVENGDLTPLTTTEETTPTSTDESDSQKCFISEDFEGVSLLRTTCLECEQSSERKETFCDICVPIDCDRANDKDEEGKPLDASAIYKRAVVTSELLVDKNKYWCSECLRYNEARRAIVFPSLPRLLVLQLKRFTSTAGSMEKINNHMPTPLVLQCFCEDCIAAAEHAKLEGSGPTASTSSMHPQQQQTTSMPRQRHVYNLYSVIMHQGATMTAGHYVAYTRLPGDSANVEYQLCERDNALRQQSSKDGQSTAAQQNGQQQTQQDTKTTHITALLTTCFGNKPTNVHEPHLRSKQQQIQQQQMQQQQKQQQQGCRGSECCGIKHTARQESGVWLECDDEAVRVIPLRELQDKLAPSTRNSATPYLLFYVRSTTGT